MNDTQADKIRILAVDDDLNILDLYGLTLSPPQATRDANDKIRDLGARLFGDGTPATEAASFELSLCRQGNKAVEAVRLAVEEDNPFAVVFLDVRMPPGPDGVWTAERIRELDPFVEIVIVTGYSDIAPEEIACRVPPTDKLLYLQKPFHAHEIQQFSSSLGAKWQMGRHLSEVHEKLEQRIAERTAALVKVNKKLKKDIAKRKKAEESLRQERERLATVLDGNPIPTFMVDHNHQVVFWNRALETLGGVPREKALGNNPSVSLSPLYQGNPPPVLADLILQMTDEELLNRYEDKIRKVGRNEAFEATTFLWSNGKKRLIEALATRIRDHRGELVGAIQCAQDITDKNRLQKKLQQAQKMEAVGTLAGGIAHDFNNLLQAVQGFVDILLLDKKQDEHGYTQLRAISGAAKRGAELTRRLLTFSRKVESKKHPVDLNHEVHQVKKLLERTIPKMIEIELDLADDLKIVNADSVQLEQVLMNLAINAKDAMPEGGKLIIQTSNVILDEMDYLSHPEAEPVEYVLLKVSDTGHGMDKETMESIFEPFYTTKGPGQGTGLGLAMVYGIVKSHGGHIDCSSELGRGTSFNIYLPATDRKARPEKTLEEQMSKGGTETILFVDDDELSRDIGAKILKRFGYTVLLAADGETALALYRKERRRIDLVISDLIMPGMGGIKCLEELLRIYPGVKVLIVSGYSATISMKKTVEAGAKNFISKPYKIGELLKAVRDILDNERM
jgi:signal transduction histidine kinase/DNA-binding response OmpR family regulator